MKKIIHITSLHPRNDIRIFQKELLSLKEAGFDAGAIVADGKGDENTFYPLYDVGTEPSRIKRFFKINRKIFEKALELNADLYHFHDPELFWVGYKLLRKGKKVIYDAHEDVPATVLSKPYIKKILRRPIAFFVRIIENYFAAKYTGIVTATPFISDRFLKINKFTIDINNYPKLNELNIAGESAAPRENAFCYIGLITAIRGLEEVLDALELIDAKLYLAGTFIDEQFKQKLESKPAWNKVIWCGFLNRQELAEMMAKTKGGLVVLHPEPNYVNSQPIKLFEYMSAKLPVIYSDFPVWNRLIAHVNCGIAVNPFDINEISSAMKKLLENDILVNEMGIAGYNAVTSAYNWDTEKMKLADFYNKILSIN